MEFERIIVKNNKYTIDTVLRLDFNKWIAFHNTYTGPPDIKLMPSYRRQKKQVLIELEQIMDTIERVI